MAGSAALSTCGHPQITSQLTRVQHVQISTPPIDLESPCARWHPSSLKVSDVIILWCVKNDLSLAPAGASLSAVSLTQFGLLLSVVRLPCSVCKSGALGAMKSSSMMALWCCRTFRRGSSSFKREAVEKLKEATAIPLVIPEGPSNEEEYDNDFDNFKTPMQVSFILIHTDKQSLRRQRLCFALKLQLASCINLKSCSPSKASTMLVASLITDNLKHFQDTKACLSVSERSQVGSVHCQCMVQELPVLCKL